MGNRGLDIAQGIALARSEMYGDWFRDPWGWPELTHSEAADIDAETDIGFVRRDREGLELAPHFHPIDVPKSRLGVRPAVVQDPLSRLAYLSAVASGLSKFHADLSEWVFGWRMRDGEMARGQDEWRSYVASMPSKEPDGTGEFGLQTDITSFFASISPAFVSELVTREIGRGAASGVIVDVVSAHDALSTRSGLPQRSYASAVLAHRVLQPVDEQIALALRDGRISKARRWMDDISAEGDREELYRLMISLQERARAAGLEINSSKTFLLPKEKTAENMHLEDLREIEIPMEAVMDSYTDETSFEPNFTVLSELEDEILTSGDDYPRPLLRAVLVSLTKNIDFSRESEWRAKAHDFAHVADALGRYFRGAAVVDPALWWDHADWFHRFESSAYGSLDWVSSQYALMFPSYHVEAQVSEVLQRWLSESTDLQQVSVAIQRLAVKDPARVRTVLRERVDRATDPLMLRVFGLGLLMAEDVDLAKLTLRRDPRNRLLVRLLERLRWAVPPTSEDFDPTPEGDEDGSVETPFPI